MTDRHAGITGPLASVAEAYREELHGLGYKEPASSRQVGLLADLSVWLEHEGVSLGALTSERVDEFLRARQRQGHTRLVTARGAATLLGYLRRSDVAPEPSRPAPSSPCEALLERYQRFLVDQRGLVPAVVAHYLIAAVLFVETLPYGGGDLASVSAGDVSAFATRACSCPAKLSPRVLVTGLRSFLRFLHVEGIIRLPLAQAVPSFAAWSASSLPKALAPGQAARLLRSCDRRTAIGRRDYAILALLARLGLRANEVAALRLEDIDWRAGEVVVRGKARRDERLPLPVDVGEAVAGYLRRGRPGTPSRAVFVRVVAPLGALTPGGVTSVVYNACDRAGVARVGAHRLRHTAGTEMLRAGASLAEIGQVLRQRSAASTAIYAKVDHAALGSVARPWPGGAA